MILWSDNQTTGSQTLNILELLDEPFQEVTKFKQFGEPQHGVEAGRTYRPSHSSVIEVYCDTTSRPPYNRFMCKKCGKSYHWKQSLNYHVRMECGKEPQLKCPYCML
jgi:hypothetical protein